MTALSCRLTGCPKPRFGRGYCRMHYDRILRYGAPGPVGMIGKRASLEERFHNNVQIYGPILTHELGQCSIWTGYQHSRGYGAIWRGHSLIYAHRMAWELAYGEPPAGRLIQLCGNKLCVRVDHLVKAGHRGDAST